MMNGVCCMFGFVLHIYLRIGFCESIEGDPCITGNIIGSCRILYNCPTAVNNLQLHGTYPERCGIEGILPIICCIENVFNTESTSTSTATPILTTTSTVVSVNKSKQKCKEYKNYLEKSPALGSVNIPIRHCPQEEPVALNAESSFALSKQFPHMAAIGYDGEDNKNVWECSGSLISEQFVLTSAGCLYNEIYGEPKYVRIGDLILNSNEDDAHPQQFRIRERVSHPRHKPPSQYHDIGLIKLDRLVHFNSYIKPACLDINRNITTAVAAVSGWSSEDKGIDYYQHMRIGHFKYITAAECNDALENHTLVQLENGVVDEIQICATSPLSNVCKGFSGAPLQIFDPDTCTYTVVGVTSFPKACDTLRVPAVFTRVSRYIKWIEETVWHTN